MLGASRAALAGVAESFDGVLFSAGKDGAMLGEQLFDVTRLLDSQPGLRRALTDPGKPADVKVNLVKTLLDGKVDDRVVEAVVALVRERWSDEDDLADACERLGVNGVLASAQADDSFDRTEDELFRFSRIVEGNPELQQRLDDQLATYQERSGIVRELLSSKATAQTTALATQAAGTLRGSHALSRIEAFLAIAAERRKRVSAVVTTAVIMTKDQEDRLRQALARVYGQDVTVNLQLDPTLMGGVRVEIGDEVIDSTIVNRLAQAKRHLEN